MSEPLKKHALLMGNNLLSSRIKSKKYFSSKGESTMTKLEMFNELLTLVENSDHPCKDELHDKIQNEIWALERKAATPRKPTATQVENETLKVELLSLLVSADGPLCIKDIQEKSATFANLSNQRITHLLTALIKDEKIERGLVKKVPYYSAK